ncbi:N-acetylneuraminate synthase [Aliarcobacter cryaerophilus]|uniref:N-acetylneuraminate synthase n=1 Tax=Aliarcobacter cryaerophilus TaxID=28198 RepID=UPI003DA225F9
MNNKVFIIAEAGVNHNANFDLAIKLIDVAKKSGADAVKFQTAVPELVMTNSATMAEYQIENIGKVESQIEMARKIHLPITDYKKLKEYCDQIGIMFLSTPFDHVSILELEKLDMEYFKIPSGEITNLPYLRHVAKIAKRVILSTGMSTMDEVSDAVKVLYENGITKDRLTLLHVTTDYPTKMVDVNLQAMLSMKEEFGVDVGYSDHTEGIEVPIAAVALGAKVIEKHFTLDKNMEGPDHKASLEPHELFKMVQSIRNIELALGDGIKKPSEGEIKNIVIARRSLVAKCDVKKGTVFSEDNLIVKRPGNGISPMRWDEIVGTVATKDYKEDELI